LYGKPKFVHCTAEAGCYEGGEGTNRVVSNDTAIAGVHMASFYDFSAPLLDGTAQSMAAYKGKVVLVVNVASKCGFTPQYSGLEAVWRSHKDQGLEILGFPCNQFGAQEPGDAEAIADFCSTTYDVTFPIFSKVEVNGTGADPLYKFLKAESPGIFGTQAIKWNFTKFLINREGEVVERFGPDVTPETLEKDVVGLL
jgi:glutathione peroxidase